MRVSSRVVGIVALSACISPKAYAPIYGTYPGLRSLIQQSEIIAAVTILDRLPEWDIGGSDRYKIEFTKILKGSPLQKQALAWLRHLEIIGPIAVASQPGSGPIHYFAPTEEDRLFRSGYRYVLFLVKSERDDGTPYENVNCEGSAFPISPLRDLDSLKVESSPETLVLFFREYVDFKRSELKRWEEELDAFIHHTEK